MFDVRSSSFATPAPWPGLAATDYHLLGRSNSRFGIAGQPGPARASCSSPDKCEFVCLQKNDSLAGPPPFIRYNTVEVPHPNTTNTISIPASTQAPSVPSGNFVGNPENPPQFAGPGRTRNQNRCCFFSSLIKISPPFPLPLASCVLTPRTLQRYRRQAWVANSSNPRFTTPVLFEQIFGPRTPPASPVVHLSVGPQKLPLLMVRNPRARRYLLRLRPDGTARVTIPRGGSTAVARQFVERHAAWLERELQRLQAQPRKPAVWQIGTEILLRGDTVCIEAGPGGDDKEIENQPSSGYGATSEDDATREAETVRFGGESVRVPGPATDLRPAIESHLRQLATRELPPRVLELAVRHGLTVRRITVRSQKSRWGSCSRRGTISLNWRLIQTPAFVSDYICLHELMHLRQMNHSPGFWREMERVCPDYPMAERWLKEHSGLLR